VRKLIILAAVALMVMMSVPVQATDDPEQRLGQIQQQITDLNKKIAAQKGQRSDVQNQLAAAQESLDAVAAELAAAESKVRDVESTIATNEQHLQEVQGELSDLELQLADTRVSIRNTQDEIVDRAVEMYMGGIPDLGSLVLGADDMTSAALGVNYAQEVVASSEALVNDFEALQALETRQKQAVEDRKAAVVATIGDLQQRRAELEADRVEVDIRRQEAQAEMDRQQGLLDQVNSDINFVEGELTALEQESKKMEAEIAARQRASGQRPSVLAWPVNGPVTSPFGWRIHPIFGTKKLHTGIDIGVAYGTSIRAASYGTVIMAGTYGGYGNATVIDHGGGLSTLYGHQSKIIVKVGQEVKLGEVIGYVGCTGYCTGPHLHFETRENGTPVDPLKYLP
jgi:murein DD-endopeptidase MepM/ murein hydrolase activator NlpD